MPRSRRRSSSSPKCSRARSARRPTSSQKEMYSFQDRGGEEITLRPEYTAGIVRAVISNGLTQSLPLKLFASGPMFRYERPQKGRFRQFHQIDVELIGVAQPLGDVEVIALGAEILDALGRAGAAPSSSSTRWATPRAAHAYRAALVDYYERRTRRARARTAGDRLERNPLRILDSKDAARQARSTPTRRPSREYLDAEARAISSTRCSPGLDRARHRLSPQPAPGARPRLLLPHRVRVRDHGAGRARHGAGRRAL